MRTLGLVVVLAASSAMAAGKGSRESINKALDWLYPKEVDRRFGLQPEPGEEEAPLAEVVVYRATKPVPHWHYVTYGLSELEEKNSDDKELSGFGVEYTLRLVDNSAEPPAWPINLLRFLAAQTWETRAPYDPTHSTMLPAGMLEEVSKGVEGLAGFEDPDLKSIDTPTGKLTFVTIIPLMKGEYALISSWNAVKVADEIRTQQGDLLWRYNRASLLTGPRATEIKKVAEKEGSSQAVVFTDFECAQRQLVIGATGTQALLEFLRYRLAYDRDGKMLTGERALQLKVGAWSYKPGKKNCALNVPKAELTKLADEVAKVKTKTVITRPGGVRISIDPAN